MCYGTTIYIYIICIFCLFCCCADKLSVEKGERPCSGGLVARRRRRKKQVYIYTHTKHKIKIDLLSITEHIDNPLQSSIMGDGAARFDGANTTNTRGSYLEIVSEKATATPRTTPGQGKVIYFCNCNFNRLGV